MYMNRALALCVVCCLLFATPAAAIQNGLDDGGLHPYVGIMAFWSASYPSSGKPFLLCSATLIAPEVVITPGHCTFGVADQFQAGVYRLGVSFDQEPEDLMVSDFTPIQSLVLHPGFDPYATDREPYDIAVARLNLSARPPHVVLPGPIPLPEAGAVDALNATGGLKHESFDVVGVSPILDWSGPGNPVVVDDYRRRWGSEPFHRLAAGQMIFRQHEKKDDVALCAGDTGGAVLRGGTDELLAMIGSFSGHCSPWGYGLRLDTPLVRDFLGQFLTLP